MSQEAERLFREAKQKLNSKGWFGRGKTDEAIELYGRAGDAFKIEQDWNSAANAYSQQGELLVKNGDVDEASISFVNAARCYKKTSPKDAIEYFKKGVEIYKKSGRLHAAASNMKQIAELYETEIRDKKMAIDAYISSSKLYIAEDSTAQANVCNLKAAHLEAEIGDYDNAIKHFEEAIEIARQNQLSRFSLREYIMKASLCYMCKNEQEALRAAISRYKNIEKTYSDTRECNFIDSLADAIEAQDMDTFMNTITKWDKITRFSDWESDLLLQIKNQMGEIDIT